MPNWCHASYIFKAKSKSKKELQRLHQAIAETIIKPSEIENDFEPGWLAKIAMAHGICRDNVPCRGSITELDVAVSVGDFGDAGELCYFRIDEETAWSPATELWEAVVEQYDGVSFVYCAEEVGNGIFVNTDVSGLFFCERYLLEICCNSTSLIPDYWPFEGRDRRPTGDEKGLIHLDIREYFSSFEKLQEYFAKLTGKTLDNAVEMQEYLDGIVSKTDGIQNAYFSASIIEFSHE